jgi:hypothetical protein
MRTPRLIKRLIGPIRVRVHLYVLRQTWKVMAAQAADYRRDPSRYYRGDGKDQAWCDRQVRAVERGIRRVKKLIVSPS